MQSIFNRCGEKRFLHTYYHLHSQFSEKEKKILLKSHVSGNTDRIVSLPLKQEVLQYDQIMIDLSRRYRAKYKQKG